MKRDSTSRRIQYGFIKLMRSPDTQELLLNDPLAFALLTVIVMPARWRTRFDVRDLKFGEALLGDYKDIGFTRRHYRTRIDRLAKWGLIATRPTQKGTIATLISTAVFDINSRPNECLTSDETAKNRPSKGPIFLPLKSCAEQPPERPTSDQQEANGRPLTNNDKKGKKERNDGLKTFGNSTPGTSSTAKVGKSGFGLEGYQNQNQPAQDHIKWPEFAEWCRGKGGQPTEAGFRRWLARQKPQWRNKVRQNFDEEGYTLDGKFLTAAEANRLAMENHALIEKFKPAVKRDGKIEICPR